MNTILKVSLGAAAVFIGYKVYKTLSASPPAKAPKGTFFSAASGDYSYMDASGVLWTIKKMPNIFGDFWEAKAPANFYKGHAIDNSSMTDLTVDIDNYIVSHPK